MQVFDRNLVQEMQKKANKTSKEGGAEEKDNFLSTVIATGNDLEQNIELMEEAIQSACRRIFQHSHTISDNSKKKSVLWWSLRLTAMRKKVNANRRLYQRTRSDEALRERRKTTYMEAKRTSSGNQEGEIYLLERVLYRCSLHKPMVASI
jgi:hypothetical protein